MSKKKRDYLCITCQVITLFVLFLIIKFIWVDEVIKNSNSTYQNVIDLLSWFSVLGLSILIPVTAQYIKVNFIDKHCIPYISFENGKDILEINLIDINLHDMLQSKVKLACDQEKATFPKRVNPYNNPWAPQYPQEFWKEVDIYMSEYQKMQEKIIGSQLYDEIMHRIQLVVHNDGDLGTNNAKVKLELCDNDNLIVYSNTVNSLSEISIIGKPDHLPGMLYLPQVQKHKYVQWNLSETNHFKGTNYVCVGPVIPGDKDDTSISPLYIDKRQKGKLKLKWTILEHTLSSKGETGFLIVSVS